MPKYNEEMIKYFMAHALNDEETDLGMYKSEEFTQDLRSIAVDSILKMLQKIEIDQKEALERGEEYSISDAINAKNPDTGLNMLEYCIVSGLESVAIKLMQNGAVSQNVQTLQQNVTRRLQDSDQPEIIGKICAIINNMVVLKQHYDQFLAAAGVVIPSIIAVSKYAWNEPKSPRMILSIAACFTLAAPFLYPLLEGAGSALLVGVASVPLILAGLYTKSGAKAQTPAAINDQGEIIKTLIYAAQKIKHELHPSLHAVVPEQNTGTKARIRFHVDEADDIDQHARIIFEGRSKPLLQHFETRSRRKENIPSSYKQRKRQRFYSTEELDDIGAAMRKLKV